MAGTLNRRQAALIADLRSRHGRKDSDLCLCDGLRACSEVIRLRPDLLESVILREDFSADLEIPVEPVRLSAGEFQKIAQTVHSQGIITVSRRPEAVAPDAPPADPFALVLDQVRDPGNLGTIIRTARGRTIVMQYSVDSPRPYSRINLIQGTKGCFCDYPPRLALVGSHLPLKDVLDRYAAAFSEERPEERGGSAADSVCVSLQKGHGFS